MGRRLCKLASEYTHWVWNGNVPLHEWNSDREWKDDGWQYYELDLKTWVFEEESFVPMALLLNGKVYSIVTDQLGTPTEAYNAEGEEVWRRRLDMNGKILEERSMPLYFPTKNNKSQQAIRYCDLLLMNIQPQFIPLLQNKYILIYSGL